ncbi:unnamed protein product [Urochloa humidicola]
MGVIIRVAQLVVNAGSKTRMRPKVTSSAAHDHSDNFWKVLFAGGSIIGFTIEAARTYSDKKSAVRREIMENDYLEEEALDANKDLSSVRAKVFPWA